MLQNQDVFVLYSAGINWQTIEGENGTRFDCFLKGSIMFLKEFKVLEHSISFRIDNQLQNSPNGFAQNAKKYFQLGQTFRD